MPPRRTKAIPLALHLKGRPVAAVRKKSRKKCSLSKRVAPVLEPVWLCYKRSRQITPPIESEPRPSVAIRERCRSTSPRPDSTVLPPTPAQAYSWYSGVITSSGTTALGCNLAIATTIAATSSGTSMAASLSGGTGVGRSAKIGVFTSPG